MCRAEHSALLVRDVIAPYELVSSDWIFPKTLPLETLGSLSLFFFFFGSKIHITLNLSF